MFRFLFADNPLGNKRRTAVKIAPILTGENYLTLYEIILKSSRLGLILANKARSQLHHITLVDSQLRASVAVADCYFDHPAAADVSERLACFYFAVGSDDS